MMLCPYLPYILAIAFYDVCWFKVWNTVDHGIALPDPIHLKSMQVNSIQIQMTDASKVHRPEKFPWKLQ